MKLTDFSILSAALFLCLFLGRDLYIKGLLAEAVSELSYNRQMDRISEDALMDVVETAYGDGSLGIQEERLQEQFERLIALSFDLTGEAAELFARETMTVFSMKQYPYNLGAQEVEQIVADIQAQMDAAKHRRRERQHLRLALPCCAREPWYQMPAGPQFFGVSDPREPFFCHERAVVSGSRIVKRQQEKGLKRP